MKSNLVISTVLAGILLCLSIFCAAQAKKESVTTSPPESEGKGIECLSGKPDQPRPKVHLWRDDDISKKAVELPQPKCPKKGKGICGTVKAEVVVQMITGKVIWARVITEEPLLRRAVEDVVCRARFPFAFDTPINVGAVITYKFRRSD